MDKKIGLNNEQGFSYIDVIMAIMITSIGVLAMTGALTTNLIRAHGMTSQVKAKQVASSTLESVFAARDIARSGGLEGWDAIGNVGSNPVLGVPKGVFLVGWNPVREKNGPDGVAGTADDACSATATCPGAIGLNPVLPGVERRIVITDMNDATFATIRKRNVEITVRFKVSNLVFEEKTTSIVADYR